jgi:DNA-binding LacI/PurR family transcriptional regulator
MERLMVVTIKDVAREAGVSHTTVSRALRGNPHISTDTTERIQRLARDMGYEPSAAARSLKTNRSQVLGVIVSSIDDPFFSEILQGIDDIAQLKGYSLFIAASQRDHQREKSIVRTMREHRVDGVIICSTPFSVEQSYQLSSFDIPIVIINNQSEEDHQYSIYHDDLHGSTQIMKHLIELGHRRIGYLGYSYAGRTDLKRLTGYQEQMQAAGLSIEDGYMIEADSSDLICGETLAKKFLSLPQPPTAIFCFNDLLAIGLMHGLQEKGIQIPEEISVAGFDNISYSAYTNPPLTTFDQPKRSIGIKAAELILSLLYDNQEQISDNKIQLLQGSLLVRKSTSAPGS